MKGSAITLGVCRSATRLNLMESWRHLPKWVSQILYSHPVEPEGKDLVYHTRTTLSNPPNSRQLRKPLVCKCPPLVHRRSITPPTSSQGSHQQQEEELKAVLGLWQEDRSGQQLRVQVEALPPAPTGSHSSFWLPAIHAESFTGPDAIFF